MWLVTFQCGEVVSCWGPCSEPLRTAEEAEVEVILTGQMHAQCICVPLCTFCGDEQQWAQFMLRGVCEGP